MMLCLKQHRVELLNYEVINLIEIKIYAPVGLKHRMKIWARHLLQCFGESLVTTSCTGLVRLAKVGLIPKKRQEE